jgi:hypothetical protein
MKISILERNEYAYIVTTVAVNHQIDLHERRNLPLFRVERGRAMAIQSG